MKRMPYQWHAYTTIMAFYPCKLNRVQRILYAKIFRMFFVSTTVGFAMLP